jgi:sulfur carrier protein
MMSVITPLQISLNGKRIDSEAATLHALLVAQGFALQGAFACAINNRFVPRTEWPTRALQSGDRIDVVSPITGG